MILLVQNEEEYNNDLRAMIMAFYPGVKIKGIKPYEMTEMVDTQRELVSEFLFVVTALFNEKKTVIKLEQGLNVKLTAHIDGNYLDKKSFRNKLKLAIYRILSDYTGRELPWGSLTGVRPTKIAMAGLNKGKSQDAMIAAYKRIYDTSHEKAVLATRVAAYEKKLISEVDPENEYCLYIGIPFCPTRCLYCSFTSYPISVYSGKVNEYIETVAKELQFISYAYRKKKLVSVYFGGGTPTSITHEDIDKLLTELEYSFDLSHVREFTVEAGRPDSITKEKLEVLKKHKVTRISINPQTMNDETLKTIGRAHTTDQTREAFLLARSLGFDNINMDIIAGLPGENIDSMKYTLSEIKKLGPDSLTVHSLAIKRAANLKQKMDEYGDSINKDMNQMLNLVALTADEMGLEPYYMYRQKNIGGNLENVGYARKNAECIYNILIMEEITDIIAAGAGASSKLVYPRENRVERVENCKSVDDYIVRFDEMLDRKQILLEKNQS